MLMNAVRGVFFVMIIALSLMGLYFLLPLWFSGGSSSDIPQLLGGVLFYAVLGVIWWLLVEKRKGATLLGVFFLSLPILALIVTSLSLFFASP